MKSSRLFLLLAIIGIAACTADNKEPAAALAEHFYKRFEGTLGDKHIVLHLNKDGQDYKGVYYAGGAWLNLQTDTVIGDSVVFFEDQYADYYWDKKKQPRMALKWINNALEGKWISTTKDTVLEVKLTEAYPAGAEKFKVIALSDSVAAFKDKKGGPKARFSFIFPQPENGNLDVEMRKAIFTKPGDGWNTDITLLRDTFFKAYAKDASSEHFYNADSVGGGYLSYSQNTSGNIKYNDKGFLVIDQFRDSYTGGAHGYYFSTMLNFDVQNKKRLKLSDIVTADSVTMQRVIEPFFRIQYNIKPGEGLDKVLFDKHLPPSENFYFNSNGLAFIYNPYEVASYAQGQLMVFIPFTALKQYLTPAFAKRIQ